MLESKLENTDKLTIEEGFEAFPWFDTAIQRLRLAFDNDRLSHGLLLCAPKYAGKRAFSLTLVKSLICTSNLGLSDACNCCKACHLFNSNTYPDFYCVDRLTDKKGKQKKLIGIEQIRSLTDKLSEMPQLGGWRIALVCSVNAMTKSSFNALLKTLEEPGEKTFLILLTDNLESVPATVRSRCQIITGEFTEKLLLNWLIEQTSANKQIALDALRKCYFAPLAARDYIENEGLSKRNKVFELFGAVFNNTKTAKEALDAVLLEEYQLSHWLAEYFYEVIVENANSTDGKYHAVPDKRVYQLYDKVIDFNRAQSQGSNLQAKLQFEAILIQWFEIGRKIINFSRS